MSQKAAIRSEAERFFAAFQAAGAVAFEADHLLPADTLLDLYGEDIRARAYVTHDPNRGEMMLRPDFTVPVVQRHMSDGAEPARYSYMGEVFRKQEASPARASEYLQVGYELFDRDDPARADAEVFALLPNCLPHMACVPSLAILAWFWPRYLPLIQPSGANAPCGAMCGVRAVFGAC